MFCKIIKYWYHFNNSEIHIIWLGRAHFYYKIFCDAKKPNFTLKITNNQVIGDERLEPWNNLSIWKLVHCKTKQFNKLKWITIMKQMRFLKNKPFLFYFYEGNLSLPNFINKNENRNQPKPAIQVKSVETSWKYDW
jgi:hypothetical protein